MMSWPPEKLELQRPIRSASLPGSLASQPGDHLPVALQFHGRCRALAGLVVARPESDVVVLQGVEAGVGQRLGVPIEKFLLHR
jgi:hypothetical protein